MKSILGGVKLWIRKWLGINDLESRLDTIDNGIVDISFQLGVRKIISSASQYANSRSIGICEGQRNFDGDKYFKETMDRWFQTADNNGALSEFVRELAIEHCGNKDNIALIKEYVKENYPANLAIFDKIELLR